MKGTSSVSFYLQVCHLEQSATLSVLYIIYFAMFFVCLFHFPVFKSNSIFKSRNLQCHKMLSSGAKTESSFQWGQNTVRMFPLSHFLVDQHIKYILYLVHLQNKTLSYSFSVSNMSFQN